jgi:polyisoprenoid-binding protein YceI
MKYFRIYIKRLTLLFLIFGLVSTISAQNIYVVKTVQISFFSSTPLENIQAKTQKVSAAINLDNGDIIFKTKVNTFEFANKLMQEHFNENYMESDKYPYAEFKGKILNTQQIIGNGTFTVDVVGKLLIHGVTKEYSTKATVIRKDNQLSTLSNFDVKLADHNIKIPSVVGKNIAEVIQIKIAGQFNPVASK